MKKLLLTILLFTGSLFAQDVSATIYYVDFSNTTPGAGTATSTAYNSLDSFTEAARTAGDIAYVRRGTATTTNITDLTFTSDGTIVAPLQIVADYGNIWGDFASSTQTYTLTVGSTTIQASATITNQMFDSGFGKWIFVQGDDQYSYAYEVKATTTDAITLYLPYKGDNAGSGKTLNIMPYAPVWNTAAGDFQWLVSGDQFWNIQGLQIRGTDSAGSLSVVVNSAQAIIKDCIFTGDGVSDLGLGFAVNERIILQKSRFFNYLNAITAGGGGLQASDCILDGNSLAGSWGITTTGGNPTFNIKNSKIINNTAYNISIGAAGYANITFINSFLSLDSDNALANNASNHSIFFEDYNNTIGDNKQFLGLSSADNTFQLLSTTTASLIRSGGGNSSIEVIPTTNFNTIWEFGSLKLFEYPIQADTTNKTYTVYFMSPSDTWTTNPTASELWIECEYWDFGTGASASRKVKKSTGTVDFNGSTAWQSLSVTCQPTNTGVLYLRAYYAKTKEAGTNLFYADVAPVISS